jgi:recombination protein RecR
LCVVESAADQAALERTGGYRGRYFVLRGRLKPLEGLGPEAIGVDALLDRLEGEPVREIILALSFTAEGEATAQAVQTLLHSRSPVPVTRLSRGVPAGSELEYVDASTIAHALAHRR